MRVFWGTDEEVSEGGVPRFIVYGYDGFPIQPVPQDEHPEEDLEYEDDEEQDGPVDYPIGERDDGGDDDDDSSRDDAADEDEDMEEEEEDEEEKEEEEEHIASADSTAVIPVVELVSSPKGTKPVL
nr:hypothetical protein [Tanacetum cinerariifolium]